MPAGRPSKLTPTQWETIGHRLALGEAAYSLGKEFNIAASQISRKFKGVSHDRVRSAAQALAALPVKDQAAALSLADELRSISGHLAAAGRYGASTAHRLSKLAHGEVQKIDDVNPLESVDALRGVSALTRLANESASTGLNLLAANKDAAKDAAKGSFNITISETDARL